MKKLLLTLALLTGVANAQTFVMPNSGGGEITLTSDACKADGGKYTSLRHAYSWTNKIYFEGCWALIDGNVHITWMFSDGTRERRVYPPSAFTKKETY